MRLVAVSHSCLPAVPNVKNSERILWAPDLKDREVQWIGSRISNVWNVRIKTTTTTKSNGNLNTSLQ
jgi:hypothetical protein